MRTKRPLKSSCGTKPWTAPLLRWFDTNRRPMPWRDNPSPYAVWISEIMLQQTQVGTVTPYFERFMKRFPTIRDLAAADLHVVLKSWEGLGYYARARNLHRTANILLEQGASLPSSVEALQKLPGIGPYSAAAIASISFGEVVPAVDANVVRVFCRFLGIATDHNQLSVRNEIGDYLKPLVSQKRAGDFNQAIMELGGLICRPRNPRCPECPLRRWCYALKTNQVKDLPVRRPQKKKPHYQVVACVIWKKGKILVARRPTDKMLGGLWEFPGGKQRSRESLKKTAHREIMEETGLEINVGRKLCIVEHAYSHFSITLHMYECEHIAGRARAYASDELRLVKPSELSELAFPAADRKIIDLLLEQVK